MSLLYHTFVNKSRRSLVYHPQLVAAYHQCGALYIIKPQENTRWRVIRNKGGDLPLMIYAALRASMIYQACGLDKQKQNICLGRQMFFFVGRGRRTVAVALLLWTKVETVHRTVSLSLLTSRSSVFASFRGSSPSLQKQKPTQKRRLVFMAGAEGLEPSARGFGDRCSTN